MILDDIVQAKREEIASRARLNPFASLRRQAASRQDHRPFSDALLTSPISLIAEIKKASPSAGIIRENFDVAAIAEAYEAAGASAVSVLTDERFFSGSLENLELARRASTLPLLRKDFIIHEYQVAEAGAAGADAFLLIAAILSKSQMEDYISLGTELGMEALVEVHQGKELDRAVDAGSRIIGINNRDLKTFHVDLNVSLELGKALPEDTIRVSESGIRSRSDVEELERHGFNAILVGETLMRGADPGEEARRLLGESS